MKMIVIVCPEGRHSEFRNTLKDSGIHTYTELNNAVGEGESGKKFGNRIWPEKSVLIFMVIEEDKKDEVADAVRQCQAKLYPSEGIRAFIMPVEEVL
ncbi:MAG: PG0541 family transporter-associated protein [Thermodesulfobacteriota bacterium]